MLHNLCYWKRTTDKNKEGGYRGIFQDSIPKNKAGYILISLYRKTFPRKQPLEFDVRALTFRVRLE